MLSPSPLPLFFAARIFALIAFTAVGGKVVRPALAAAFADARTALGRPDPVRFPPRALRARARLRLAAGVCKSLRAIFT